MSTSTVLTAVIAGGAALLGVAVFLDYKRRSAPDYHEQVVQSACVVAWPFAVVFIN
jgi:hypothetical protein